MTRQLRVLVRGLDESTELLQELPPQRHSAVLIDFYFKYMYVLQYTCPACILTDILSLTVTGRATRSQSKSFVLRLLKSRHTVLKELALPTQTTSGSFPYYLLFSPSLRDLHLSISQEMHGRDVLLLFAIIGLVSLCSSFCASADAHRRITCSKALVANSGCDSTRLNRDGVNSLTGMWCIFKL